jgi:hypothetical protein
MIEGDLLYVNLWDDEEFEFFVGDEDEEYESFDECFICKGDHYAAVHL